MKRTPKWRWLLWTQNYPQIVGTCPGHHSQLISQNFVLPKIRVEPPPPSIHQIQQALKQGNHVLGIFIDLSKAFDTIGHIILLEKLENYGVRGTTLKLIKSYLSDRNQYLNLLSKFSHHLPVIFGLPQAGFCTPFVLKGGGGGGGGAFQLQGGLFSSNFNPKNLNFSDDFPVIFWYILLTSNLIIGSGMWT